MNSIFDYIGNDLGKFIATAEKMFPGFKSKMGSKLKEDAGAKILQEEQNLTGQIDEAKKLVDGFPAEVSDAPECRRSVRAGEALRQKPL